MTTRLTAFLGQMHDRRQTVWRPVTEARWNGIHAAMLGGIPFADSYDTSPPMEAAAARMGLGIVRGPTWDGHEAYGIYFHEDGVIAIEQSLHPRAEPCVLAHEIAHAAHHRTCRDAYLAMVDDENNAYGRHVAEAVAHLASLYVIEQTGLAYPPFDDLIDDHMMRIVIAVQERGCGHLVRSHLSATLFEMGRVMRLDSDHLSATMAAIEEA